MSQPSQWRLRKMQQSRPRTMPLNLASQGSAHFAARGRGDVPGNLRVLLAAPVRRRRKRQRAQIIRMSFSHAQVRGVNELKIKPVRAIHRGIVKDILRVRVAVAERRAPAVRPENLAAMRILQRLQCRSERAPLRRVVDPGRLQHRTQQFAGKRGHEQPVTFASCCESMKFLPELDFPCEPRVFIQPLNSKGQCAREPYQRPHAPQTAFRITSDAVVLATHRFDACKFRAC